MQPSITPTLSLIFALLACLCASPAIIWDPHSYDGGVRYVSDEPAVPQLLLLNDCHYYVADGMAAADGYPSGRDFYAGCYAALKGP